MTNYEVIRFIQHGNRCRPAMDCVPGELLIYRVRQYPMIEKETLFAWMKQLSAQIGQYHRCRNNQCYRYINPYSVLITKDEKILLLDMDAQSNEFVLKNMQKRAMREHFVKPIVHIKENARITLDLYGYAKTIQFLLAGMKADPALTRWEEHRLSKIIDKCLTEDLKKQYKDMEQVERELPSVKGMAEGKLRRMGLAVSAVLLLSVGLISFFYGRGDTEEVNQVQTEHFEAIEPDQEKTVEKIESTAGPADGVDAAEEEVHAMEQYLLRNTEKDNQEVIRQGEKLHREILRYLAAAYDRIQSKERALQVYRELCVYENQVEYLETAYVRRIVLEREIYAEDKQAVATGKEAMERFPASEQLGKEYAQTVVMCTGLEQKEKNEILQELTERFPAIKETESYIRWEAEKKKEETEEKEKQSEAENAEQNESENIPENTEPDMTEDSAYTLAVPAGT